jgi:hypothetical protein
LTQKEDDIGSKEKELGVLEWVMARQQQSQFINQGKLNELTSKLNITYQELTNKPASNLSQTHVTKPTDNNKSSKSSNVGSELKWKSNYSSDSDASLKK